jgi:putative transposase
LSPLSANPGSGSPGNSSWVAAETLIDVSRKETMRPRPVIENRTYMFTRRCSERRFFLRPDAETTNAFWYCLGWAAQKHGQILHAAVALSNHVHVAATDPHGVYPDFLRDFHGLLARVVNAWRGRWEHFWDANQASVVLLEDQAAQLDKVTYVLANPIGLVQRAGEWPGATALHGILMDRPIVATRPKHFFRDGTDGGEMPENVTLTFEPPPALVLLPRQQYIRLLQDNLAVVEIEAAKRRQASGTVVLGRKRILAQHWNDRPIDAEPRGELNPSLACRDKWRRIECLRQNKLFQALYRAAFHAFRSGAAAIFPFGTWSMRFRAAIQISTA